MWLLLPRVAAGIAISAALVFVLFWLRFGEVNSFTVLIAAAAAVFQIMLVVGLRHTDRGDRRNDVPESGILFMVGAFWLVAVFFGPLIGWFTASLADANPKFAIQLHAVTFVLTIVLPIATSLPNYRYVTFGNAHITLPMLFTVSLLPSLVGWRSAAALWQHFIN